MHPVSPSSNRAPLSLHYPTLNSKRRDDLDDGMPIRTGLKRSAEAYAHSASRTQSIFVLVVCIAWMAVSSGAIMINRSLMVDLGFRYPVTVAWLGLLTSTALASIWVELMIPKSHRQQVTRHDYFTRIVPVGFFMALTFQCGNTGYLYLTVAFVQMLKALCPVVTMLLLFVARLEKATSRLVATVVVISMGISMASFGELNLSVVGLVAMLTSVVSESIRLVMTQHLLVGRAFHPMEGLKYIGSACTMWLMLQAYLWELAPIMKTRAYEVALHNPLPFIVAACAGFGVNALAILVIKLASSLTLKVLGSVKDTLLVAVGVLFLHEVVTMLQFAGYSISLCGFISYNMIKSSQSASAALNTPRSKVIGVDRGGHLATSPPVTPTKSSV
eukprot:gene21077-27958_t